MARRKRKVEEQMDLLKEGGLKDEGGTVDPISGNDVPSGSTQKEVRDDIPAQLSEGEFVFPADVVRYIGLENLMELRQKAKQGLGQMEAMGQMGNSDEATMSDTEPFEGDIDTLIDEFDPDNPDTFEFNLGGVVPGQLTSSQTTPMYQAPATLPSFTSFVQQPARQAAQAVQPVVEQKEYIGPNGERITIQFVNGNPATPIPEGYKPFDPTAQPVTPEISKPKVSQEDSSDDRERSESRKKQYADSLTEINTLSELSPEFKEWAEKNIPGQVKAAKAMTIDPMTGEISFPSMSLTDSLKGVFSGEMYTQLAEGLQELGGTGAYGKAYSDIAKSVGMDIDAYKKNGFLDKKSFLENVKNVMEDPNFKEKAKQQRELEGRRSDYEVSGLSKEQVDAQIAEDLDEIADAIDRGDIGDNRSDEDNNSPGASSDGGYNGPDDAPSDSDFGMNKGGLASPKPTKPKRKPAMKRGGLASKK